MTLGVAQRVVVITPEGRITGTLEQITQERVAISLEKEMVNILALTGRSVTSKASHL